jgi:hypothetical protein
MAINLEEQLTRAILGSLEARAAGEERPAFRGAGPSLIPRAQAIARELVLQAVADGMPLTQFDVESTPLGGGNTAGLVATATLHARFVFKLDHDSRKLAEEGLLMRRLRSDPKLPQSFRDSFPRVYAVRTESPFAFLMEIFPEDDHFRSLENLLYPAAEPPPSDANVFRWVHAALDLLFQGYDHSVDPRGQPNLFVDYVDRIKDRLQATARSDDRYNCRPVQANGELLPPWDETLRALARERPKILSIAPGFITHVHGDPNPGNLILRDGLAGIEVKQIDPKEWGTGDYLFDVTKVTHFLAGTGPAEKTTYGTPTLEKFAVESGETIVDYRLASASWTSGAVEAIRERTRRFATQHGDPHWELRYMLGMAANLLGLPLGRLSKKPEAAAILYAEGLRWLQGFRERLERL